MDNDIPIFDNTKNGDEQVVQNKLRPLSLSDFQGQSEIKKNISLFIKAAKSRGDILDHLFLSGPPGLGKTTLATIMAHEMGGDLKVTSAPALDKPKDLAGILTSLTANTLFFIDEIHRLKPALEEMLYVAMEDYEIDWVIGQGVSARSIRVPIQPFTLIGATTRPGMVAAPLYSRFGIDISIDLYSEKEILAILYRSASILGVKIEEEAASELSRCCRGTPRIANRLIRRMRDFAEVEGNGVITKEIVSFGLHRLQIDDIGLTNKDREILFALITYYDGGPVGAQTLALSVGEASDSLEDFYEPYLIRRGLIKRTPRGRVATEAAYKILSIPFVNESEKRGAKSSSENYRLQF